MKYLLSLIIATIICSCSSSGSYQLYQGDALTQENEIHVIFPYTIKVIRLNDKRVSFPILSGNKEKTIRLKPGKNKLSFVYEGYFEDDAKDDHDFIYSDIVYCHTFDGQAGQTYRVSHKIINNKDEAKVFANSPEFNIALTNGDMTKTALATIDKKFDNAASNSHYIDSFTSFWEKGYETEEDRFTQWIYTNQYKSPSEVILPGDKKKN